MLSVFALGSRWRSASLSAAGIVVGVAAVLVLVAVARAVGATSTSSIDGLAPNQVVVYPAGLASSGIQVNIGTRNSLTPDDVTALGNPGYVPDAVRAIPTAGLRDAVTARSTAWVTDIIGSTSNFPGVRNYSIAEGRFFSPSNVNASSSVAVIGQTVATHLFATSEPVGQTVRINNNAFTVIGVFSSRGYSGAYDQDDLVVTPITAAWAYLLPPAAPQIQQIVVQATSGDAARQVKSEVTQTLLRLHDITNPLDADFEVRTQQDLVRPASHLGTVVSWAIGALAAAALLTGTIGVSLFMLGRVTAGGGDIDASRAIGLARADLVTLIMLETLVLAGIAGVAGIVVGVGGTRLVGDLLTDLPRPAISVTAVGVAAAAAIVAGVLAGVRPALQAVRRRPAAAIGGAVAAH